jgi:hypothetical protein
MPGSCLCSEVDCGLLEKSGFDRFGRYSTQSHEAAFESYADASQSLPYRGSVEISPSTAQFTTTLREDVLLAEVDSWLLIFRPICKRESWAQHASTQPPGSDFKFVSRSYNVGSVLLLGC